MSYESLAYALLFALVAVCVFILAWPLLKRAGGNVYMTWEEVRLKTGPTAAEVRSEPLNWADFPEWRELRDLGRPANRERPANVERRAA